jgi:uncharacterized protein (DUF1330 family)
MLLRRSYDRASKLDITVLRQPREKWTMNSNFKIALAIAAGAAFGAAAMQGLHAQAKPKAYLVTESEVLDAAALASYTAAISAVQKTAGGRSFGTRGKIVATVGEAPKRVGISEWDSLEQVQTYINSPARKDLVEGKKVVKINRQYIVEASN